jgi:NADH dehydrogenase
MPRRIIIVGGGFGGVKCARRLRAQLPASEWEIVLFNRENHMVFHPLLAEVAGASINANAVAAPLRQLLSSVSCRSESVTAIDLDRHTLEYEALDGHGAPLPYDHLVLACGRPVNLNAVPGMSDHAFALKTIGDALSIRAHAIQQLEIGEVSDDPDARRHALSFIGIGDGFSGVEMAGELNDLVRSSRRFYPHIDVSELSITIVHSGNQILPEVSSDLRDFARRKMEEAGITILLGARAAAVTNDGIWLKDGRRLFGATVVSTIGTTTHRLIERLVCSKENGALCTEPDMRLSGYEGAWSIGDCARIMNGADGKVCPTTGQFAERQGRQVADNIVRAIRGEPTKPFSYRPQGQLCAIGGRNAVAEIRGMHLSGFPAWWVWRTVYLLKLPSWGRRIKVAGDWTWELFFPRDLMSLRPDPTERVSHAFYREGDYVFRQGDPAQNFYAVEKGEVEVMRRAPAGDRDDLIAVLGPGEFFGEMALLEHRPRSATVRAKSDAEITVLGTEVFTRLSKALLPLQQRLVQSLRRRSNNLWSRLPEAHSLLEHEPLSTFIEPVPATLRDDQPFDDAVKAFAARHIDIMYVLDQGGLLSGVITRSDLFRAVDAIVVSTAENADPPTVRTYMSPAPITVAAGAKASTAAELMWSRGLKSVPVVSAPDGRELTGYVRAETLMLAVSNRARTAGV